MSMIMQYIRIRDEELTTLRSMLAADPDGAFDYADELADGSGDDVPAQRSRSLDTDKTWDAIGFLIHRAGEPTVCPVRGGVRLTDDEWGYEPPRYLSPADVASASAYLAATPFDLLGEHFDPAQMTAVYPVGGWTDSSALDYLRVWYEHLSAFFSDATRERDGMIVFLS